LKTVEELHILRVVGAYNDNRSEGARILEIDRSILLARLKKIKFSAC